MGTLQLGKNISPNVPGWTVHITADTASIMD
jgi:hypothetical protein